MARNRAPRGRLGRAVRFLLVIAAVLMAAAPASAASLKRVDTGVRHGPVAAPTGGFVAYMKKPGQVIVRGEPGSLSVRTVPRTCVPAAASTHSLALNCGSSVLVDDFVTGDRITIDAPKALALGRHWIHVTGPSGPALVSLDDRRAID